MDRAKVLRAMPHFRGPFLSLLLACVFLVACQRVESPPVHSESLPQPLVSLVKHPEWSLNQSIYEVNVRQYSPSGDFAGFENHLPRLKGMGLGILWFMPIHPIGEENRKGNLGSYYSVRDYYGVNPEFGTLEEFKALVDKIHQLGMYVIIDWVANHSAWDNPLTMQHPDWYMRDSRGQFFPPVPDWADVIDLNYNNPGIRDYMVEAMKFWIEQVDVDGFRCDVASMVPMDFWNRARAELEQIKPVFLLAEAEGPEFHHWAFDMTYAWGLYHIIKGIAGGTRTVADLDRYLRVERQRYPRDAFRMNFTSNHDENSWNGTVFERLGDAAEALGVLTATLEGMPLVYSGQEAGLDRRLEFFEKDVIEWREHEFAELYATLLNLKRDNKALWNGEWGGLLFRVKTSADHGVFAFVREKDEDKIFVLLNLSEEEQNVDLEGESSLGEYTDAFTGERVTLSSGTKMRLKPWAYQVFYR